MTMYWQALAGGILLGLGALMLMLFNGRIAGISGILYGAISNSNGVWRWAFLAGIVLGPALTAPFGVTLPANLPVDGYLLALSGLLVGFGTRYGSGCTSGHGICGIGRLSGRSILATCVFMALAIITVFIIRHLLELSL